MSNHDTDTPDTTQDESAPDLDAARLDAIAAAADAELAPQPLPGQEAPAPEPEPDHAGELRALLGLGVMMAAPALPFIPQCYTPQVLDNIAQAGAAVMVKHGWTLGDVMTPEVTLAAVTLPPTIQAYVMWRQWQADKAQAPAAHGAQQVAQVAPHGMHPTQGARVVPMGAEG